MKRNSFVGKCRKLGKQHIIVQTDCDPSSLATGEINLALTLRQYASTERKKKLLSGTLRWPICKNRF